MAVMTTTQVMAQRIDIGGTEESLKKLDETLENPKKNIKAATWLKHADSYYNAGKEAVKTLYAGLPIATVRTNFGKERGSKDVTFGGKAMKELTFYFVTVYEMNGNVAAWKQTRDVVKDPFSKALSSYAKALEIDPSVKSKVDAGIDKIANHFRDAGNNYIAIEDYPAAAEAFYRSNKARATVDKSLNDPSITYMSGYLYTIEGSKNPDNKKAYSLGERHLRAAIKEGYDEIEMADENTAPENRGKAYYYTFHCVMGGSDELTTERLIELKNFMAGAVTKFPENNNLMECLMQLYTMHGDKIGTPDEALEMIEKGLAADPDKLSLWYSRGRIYSSLKNNDECIKSFENVARLDPEGFNGHFYTGVFYTSKADEFNEVMKEKNYTKQADYNADYDVLSEMYKKALPSLERAYEIKSDDVTVAEYLKSIYFRIREQEGMMDKYNKYNDIYKKLSGQE